MAKFLSNDRKVILKSAASGTGIITLLYLMLSLNTDSIVLWILAICGLLAVHRFIPTWFSRNRTVEKMEIKHFTPEGIELNSLTATEYQYFNADGEEVRKLSSKELLISIICGLTINLLLIFVIYPKLTHLLITGYPYYQNTFIKILINLAVITPYLVFHIYNFVLNRPINAPLTLKWISASYIHKYQCNDGRSQSYNFATNPIYSSMSCNQYHYRHK
jgi:hypothetical protein